MNGETQCDRDALHCSYTFSDIAPTLKVVVDYPAAKSYSDTPSDLIKHFQAMVSTYLFASCYNSLMG